MAKRLSLIISPIFQNPKPLSNFRYFSITINPQNQNQQQITTIAKEISKLIQSSPKWEKTLISNYPNFNFSDPNFFIEVLKFQANPLISVRLFNWLKTHFDFSPDNSSFHSLFNDLIKSKAFVVAKCFLDSMTTEYVPIEVGSEKGRMYVALSRPLVDGKEKSSIGPAEVGSREGKIVDLVTTQYGPAEVGSGEGRIDETLPLSEKSNLDSIKTTTQYVSTEVGSREGRMLDLVATQYGPAEVGSGEGRIDETLPLSEKSNLDSMKTTTQYVPTEVGSSGESEEGKMYAALLEWSEDRKEKFFIDAFAKLKLDPKVLETLICCLCSGRYVDEAIDLFKMLKSLGVCPLIGIWNAVFCAAIRVKRTDVVWGLYEEMMKLGVFADVETAGYLIQACCIDKDFEKGYELLLQVWDGRVVPDNFAMTRLISGLSEVGRFDRVSELLHLMIETNQKPDIYTYHGIIYGLCKNGNVAEGYRVFNDLKVRGYAPDRVMYTTMIHRLCRIGWFEKATKLWYEMKEKGMVPNEYTYNVLIHQYCRMSDLEKALELRKEMGDRGIKMNTVNYNTLIAGFCKNGKLKEAFDLFEEMPQNGVARNTITYNSLIRGLCREGDLAKGQVLYEELLAQGLEPSTSSYTPFIEQLCRSGRTQQALELLTDMMNRGIEPSVYIRECIIDGWCKEGSPIEGMHWLSEMLDRKLFPSWRVCETLILSLLKQDKLDATLHVLKSVLPFGYMLKNVICCSLASKLCSTNSNNVEMLIDDLISSAHAS